MSRLSGSYANSAPAARLAALATGTFVCTRAVLDPDLWWHIRLGADVLDTRRLTTIDPYSFTQDVPWINHEWLSDAIAALAYRGGGVEGLLLLKGVVLAAIFVLLASAARRAGPAGAWMLAACAISLNWSGATIRPQFWTMLGLAVVLSCASNRLTARGALYAIPPIFALWANLHGGWIVGLAVMGLWVIGRFIDTRRVGDTALWMLALGLGFLATGLNPYGWRLWSFLLGFVRITHDVTEWRPVWQQDGATEIVTWVVVSLGIVAPTLFRSRGAITWAAALPVTWLAIMSLLVARMLPIYGEVALLCLAGAWWESISTQSAVDDSGHRSAMPALGRTVVDVIVVVAVALANLVPASRCLTTDRTWVPDYEAAGALATVSADGRLTLPYDWGGFAIWHWGPRLKVSVDSRHQTVYSAAMLATQTAVETGRSEGMDFLRRERPEYVWLPAMAAAPTRAWLVSNGYRIDVETRKSFIAARADLPVVSPGPALSRCFP